MKSFLNSFLVKVRRKIIFFTCEEKSKFSKVHSFLDAQSLFEQIKVFFKLVQLKSADFGLKSTFTYSNKDRAQHCFKNE